MNILFVSLLNPYSPSHKGDFKLLNQRATLLLTNGHTVTSTFFRLSLFSFLPQVCPPTSLYTNYNVLTINVPFIPFIAALIFLFPTHVASRKPLQTLLSRVYSLLTQNVLDKFYKGYDSVHFFHVRSAYFFLHSQHIPNPFYELIDSYALNLSRRLLLSTSTLSRLLFKYEASSIENEEFSIINHQASPKVVFVSHLDVEHYASRAERLPVSIPLYTNLFEYKEPIYAPGSPINIGFFGNLNYHPNIYAVRSLIELSTYNESLVHPLPLRFHVGGRFLPSNLCQDLAKTNFNVVSPIPSIPDFLDEIDVCIFFMRAGSGMQSKLLEAASNSCLLITSQQPYDAIFNNPYYQTNKQAGLVASSIADIHCYLSDIYIGSISTSEIAKNAYSYIHQYYSAQAVSLQYLKALAY